jgi:hypothetical protein
MSQPNVSLKYTPTVIACSVAQRPLQWRKLADRRRSGFGNRPARTDIPPTRLLGTLR